MKVFDLLKEIRQSLSKEAASKTSVSSSKNQPYVINWMINPMMGVPRNMDINTIRQLAKSSFVQMAENAILRQLIITNWDIVPKDENDEGDYTTDKLKARNLLENPNRNGDQFWDLWIPAIRDTMEIDSGVIWKGRTAGGELVELFSYDGSRFLADMDNHGIISGWFQYSFINPLAKPNRYEIDEIIYLKMNPSNDLFPYGFSIIQSIQQEIELMIQSTRFNKGFFENNCIPDGIVVLPSEKEQLERTVDSWETQIKGKPHRILFHNIPGADFLDLSKTNKDMEWLEGQKWYFHVVFGAFGMSPQEVGFYENSNRSTGESQERVTIKNAIKPWLTLIKNAIDKEILPELLGHDKLQFNWVLHDSAEEKIEHDQAMQKLTAGVYTINELRIKEGLETVEWGDKPMNLLMQEQFQQNFDQNNSQDKETDVIINDLREKTNNNTKQINLVLKYAGIKSRVSSSGFRNSPTSKTLDEIKEGIETVGITDFKINISKNYFKDNKLFRNKEELKESINNVISKLPPKAKEIIKKDGTEINLVTKGEARKLQRAHSDRALGYYVHNNKQIYIFPIKDDYSKSFNIDEELLNNYGFSKENIDKLKNIDGKTAFESIILHELGHATALNDNSLIQSDYNKFSNELIKSQSPEERTKDFITEYAMTNGKEDFAETFAYYSNLSKECNKVIESPNIVSNNLKEKFKFMRDKLWQ